MPIRVSRGLGTGRRVTRRAAPAARMHIGQVRRRTAATTRGASPERPTQGPANGATSLSSEIRTEQFEEAQSAAGPTGGESDGERHGAGVERSLLVTAERELQGAAAGVRSRPAGSGPPWPRAMAGGRTRRCRPDSTGSGLLHTSAGPWRLVHARRAQTTAELESSPGSQPRPSPARTRTTASAPPPRRTPGRSGRSG